MLAVLLFLAGLDPARSSASVDACWAGRAWQRLGWVGSARHPGPQGQAPARAITLDELIPERPVDEVDGRVRKLMRGGVAGGDREPLTVVTANATSWKSLKRYLNKTDAAIVMA